MGSIIQMLGDRVEGRAEVRASSRHASADVNLEAVCGCLASESPTFECTLAPDSLWGRFRLRAVVWNGVIALSDSKASVLMD